MLCQAFSRPIVTIALAASVHAAVGQQFLKHSTPQTQQQLLSQLEGLFDQGRGGRVQRLEDRIRPVFEALPKDANRRLDVQGAKYAVHRYFSGFHGTNIEGLSPKGRAVNDTSPMAFLDGRVPPAVQDAIEAHVKRTGFSLRDVSVLAAVVELLVQTETVEMLRVSYERLGKDPASPLTKEGVDKVLSLYYAIFILTSEGVSVDTIVSTLGSMPEAYPGWDDTMMFVKDMQGSLEFRNRRTDPFANRPFTFDRVLHIVEAANDKYGKFQNQECSGFRDTLLEREFRGTGRILLSDFYKMALDGDWRFSEKREYLRALGALDESDPAKPSVIIVNYVTGASNCFQPSGFYSVCCLDECEDLLGHLEKTFAVSDVEPERILNEVMRLPSSTVAAPRNLSKQLADRLYETASFHGGSVPLHGRLFAQWMHHAYPRECPYPHVAGTVKSTQGANGFDSRMTQADLELYWSDPTAAVPEARLHKAGDEFDDEPHRKHHHDHDQLPHLHSWREPTPWTEEEEFFARRGAPTYGISGRVGSAASLLRQVAMLVIVLAMALNLMRMMPVLSRSPTRKDGFDRYSV